MAVSGIESNPIASVLKSQLRALIVELAEREVLLTKVGATIVSLATEPNLVTLAMQFSAWFNRYIPSLNLPNVAR
jgi:hypothetical protein